nr:hypothetical protein [Tanacetum cinerariifolium]
MLPKPDLVFNTAPIAIETDHIAFNVQLSPTKPVQDLSPTPRPSAPIIKDWLFDSENESDPKTLQFVPSFAQSSKHVKSHRHTDQQIETTIPAATPVPASFKTHSSGNGRNKKACFYAPWIHSKPQKHMVPTAVFTQSKPVSNNAVRPLSAALPNITVTRPRHAHHVFTKSKSPIRRHITRSPSSKTSNSPPRVTAAKAPVGNPQQALKDKGVIDSGCSRHMIGNMSYLSEFKELNGGYVAFGGSPKGGKITGKGKIKTEDCLQKFLKMTIPVLLVRKASNTKPLIHLGVFLATKDETSPIFKTFITGLEINLVSGVPRTSQKNGIAERKNRTLIKTARTMLADLLLPILFWAEAVNTACYVQNRVLVTKPHNKSHYELLHGRTPSIGFMRPFGCLVTILNTLDPLGKYQGKVDEGFLVGYSICSKAFRVFNSRTCIIQETLHVNFLENKPNVAGFQDKFAAEKAREEVDQTYVLFPVWSAGSTNPQNNDKDATFDGKEHDFDAKKPESVVILSSSSSAQSRKQDDQTKKKDKGKSPVGSFTRYRDLNVEFEDYSNNSSNKVLSYSNNKNHKDHHVPQNIGDLSSTTQTKSMTRAVKDQGGLSQTFGTDFHTCMFACFLSQEEPKRVHQALKDPSWIEAMQEELVQFKMQKVWVLVDLPYGKRAIGTKWVYRNKKDKRGIHMPPSWDLWCTKWMSKSAFLYETIKEEVYICQIPGFEDPDHPDKVYKVVKALYGLHQAPRAWYETLATYLLENGFQRGTIDRILFIKKQKGDILLVQIYVDDIIFVPSSSTRRLDGIPKHYWKKHGPVLQNSGLVFNMRYKRKHIPPSAPSKRHNFVVNSAPPS